MGATTESPLFVLEKDPHLIAAMEKSNFICKSHHSGLSGTDLLNSLGGAARSAV